jgi:hypothetical protein
MTTKLVDDGMITTYGDRLNSYYRKTSLLRAAQGVCVGALVVLGRTMLMQFRQRNWQLLTGAAVVATGILMLMRKIDQVKQPYLQLIQKERPILEDSQQNFTKLVGFYKERNITTDNFMQKTIAVDCKEVAKNGLTARDVQDFLEKINGELQTKEQCTISPYPVSLLRKVVLWNKTAGVTKETQIRKEEMILKYLLQNKIIFDYYYNLSNDKWGWVIQA